MYMGIQLACWTSWDFIPLISILIIHYSNFSSFKDEENIMFTEYTDDHRGTNFSNMLYTDVEDLLAANKQSLNQNPLEASLNGIDVESDLNSSTEEDLNSIQQSAQSSVIVSDRGGQASAESTFPQDSNFISKQNRTLSSQETTGQKYLSKTHE